MNNVKTLTQILMHFKKNLRKLYSTEKFTYQVISMFSRDNHNRPSL